MLHLHNTAVYRQARKDISGRGLIGQVYFAVTSPPRL